MKAGTMTKKYTATAVICARANSKRVPGKNLKLIARKPMVQWSMIAAVESGVFEHILLTSESKAILDLALPGVTPIERPNELSRDEVNQYEPMFHAIGEHNAPTDYICLVTACCPMTTSKLVQDTAAIMFGSDNRAVITLKVAQHPWHLARPIYPGKPWLGLQSFTDGGAGKQTPELPTIYCPSGNLSWFNYRDIVAGALELGVYTSDTYGYVVSEEDAIDVDTPFDFRVAEFLLKEREGKPMTTAIPGFEPD